MNENHLRNSMQGNVLSERERMFLARADVLLTKSKRANEWTELRRKLRMKITKNRI